MIPIGALQGAGSNPRRSSDTPVWHRPMVVGAWLAFGLAAASYAVTWARGEAFVPVIAGVLILLAVWMPAGMSWSAVLRGRRRSTEGRLTTAAMTAFALGTTWNLVLFGFTGSLPFPSFGDIGYVAFYPLLLCALVLALRGHLAELRGTVVVDGANSVLAVLALLSVALGPTVSRAVEEGLSLRTLLAVTYPVCDLLLATAVVGVLVARGSRAVVGWGWLTAGLLVFVATDVAFSVSTMDVASLSDSPMELGWLLGLLLVGRWVVSLEEHPGRGDAPPLASVGFEYSQTAATATTASATLAGLVVLVLGTRVRLSVLSIVLFGLTIITFGVRAQIALRHVRHDADLRKLAATDDLTGLPNRRALYTGAHDRLGATEPVAHALLLMDLNGFKEVNDTLGHHMGDKLLVEVGSRLRSMMPEGALLARLGGDEFAVLLATEGPAHCLALAEMVNGALADALVLDDMVVEMTVSIGIAIYPDDGEDLPSLLRRADIAMYRAKRTHTPVQVYAPEVDAADTDRLRRIVEVRSGLDGGEFVVHYQPKLDLRTRTIDSVEALVRWQHPVRGLLPPGEFLGLVEDAGLMHQMTQTVLVQALDQVAGWRKVGLDLSVAVNLSASSLMDTGLPKRALAMLALRGIPSGRLQFEITEDVLMHDRERARAILTVLRLNGVRIAIDDFGTGYSSLSYLRDLPIDELKLDRSFVQPMSTDHRAAALVSSTIILAHSLDLVIVAEGVEDSRTMAQLIDLACDQAQGFHIARPMPGDAIPVWLGGQVLGSDVRTGDIATRHTA